MDPDLIQPSYLLTYFTWLWVYRKKGWTKFLVRKLRWEVKVSEKMWMLIISLSPWYVSGTRLLTTRAFSLLICMILRCLPLLEIDYRRSALHSTGRRRMDDTAGRMEDTAGTYLELESRCHGANGLTIVPLALTNSISWSLSLPLLLCQAFQAPLLPSPHRQAAASRRRSMPRLVFTTLRKLVTARLWPNTSRKPPVLRFLILGMFRMTWFLDLVRRFPLMLCIDVVRYLCLFHSSSSFRIYSCHVMSLLWQCVHNMSKSFKWTSPDSIIVGAPTWNTDEEEERSGTEWDTWLYNSLPKLDLSGKKVAVFGVGDQQSYNDVSVDEMNMYELSINPFLNTLIATPSVLSQYSNLLV